MNWIVLAALLVTGCNVSPRNNEAADADRAVGVGRVSMSNIDVSSEVGADRLLRRIRDGARARCQIGQGLAGENMAARQQACMHTAMESDVARVESPVLTARFRRLGESMIAAAIPSDAASANQRAHAIINANARADLTIPAGPTRGGKLTTDDLNRREAARLRAAIGDSGSGATAVLPEG